MSVSTVNNEFSSAHVGQDVAFTSSAAAFTIAYAGRWRFFCTEDCWVRRCASGDAIAASANGSVFWPAGTIWFEDVLANDIAHSTNRFSVLRSTADGTLRVSSASR